MFCPICKAEYVDGISHCPDCNVDLVNEIHEEDLNEKIELEVVYQTADTGKIPLVRSILEDARIPFKTKSEGLQTIYGLGIVKFQVRREMAEIARKLLEELN